MSTTEEPAAELLARLREALGDEHDVRLAVLYGSMARGDADEGSDLDVLVSLADDRPTPTFKLATRLQDIGGRHVDVAHLARVELGAPLLLDQILDEGRVLVDRDGQWERLCGGREAIRVRARREYRRQMAGAGRALEELAG
jgi:predicted nucleotidyltransferase